MSVVTLTISSEGATIAETVQVVSVDVRREVNRVPSATLVMLDGDAATQTFAVSDAGTFDPGKQVKIKARYENGTDSDAVLFEGVVVRHALHSGPHGSLLKVELRDKLVALTSPRKSRVLADKSDADVVKQLVGDAGGRVVNIPSTVPVHKAVVQYDCSDWDLIVSRADANGLVVVATDGALSMVKPAGSGSSVLTVNYGVTEVYEVDFETDALGRSTAFSTLSWDQVNQKALAEKGSASEDPPLGRLKATKAATALGYGPATLMHGVALEQKEASAWADAEAQRQELSLVRGRISVVGTAKVRLLDKVTLSGLPKAFKGDAPVTGLAHRIDDNGWVTDFQFGLSPRPYRSRDEIVAPAAAGLWPAAPGLQIGVVEAVGEDPDKEFRLKVKVPALGDDAPGLWARLASPDAGKDRGWYFCPEPGDEVVLGFFNQDPRHPVVLGALYGSKNTPKADIANADDGKNNLRGLVTRSGMTLLFEDLDKPKLTIKMPSGASLLMDDDGKAVKLTDAAGNTLTLDDKGILLKTDKDFKVDAGGNVEIKGTQVDLK